MSENKIVITTKVKEKGKKILICKLGRKLILDTKIRRKLIRICIRGNKLLTNCS